MRLFRRAFFWWICAVILFSIVDRSRSLYDAALVVGLDAMLIWSIIFLKSEPNYARASLTIVIVFHFALLIGFLPSALVQIDL
jgi:uncharacterized membrane protein YhaH (DUF805 family)